LLIIYTSRTHGGAGEAVGASHRECGASASPQIGSGGGLQALRGIAQISAGPSWPSLAIIPFCKRSSTHGLQRAGTHEDSSGSEPGAVSITKTGNAHLDESRLSG